MDRKKIIFVILLSVILLVVCVLMGTFVLSFILSKNLTNNSEIIPRFQSPMIASNGKYVGAIDEETERVRIFNQAGKEVSHIEFDECPDQIAIGEDSCFLLYLISDSQLEEGKIVQYDYRSQKKGECVVSNISSIVCIENYLVIGDKIYRDKEMVNTQSCYDAMCFGKRYIEEEEFGEKFKKLKRDNKGCCQLGNTKLYCHKEGYYSTEPLKGSAGSLEGFFLDSLDELQMESQERRNRIKLFQKIDTVKNKDLTYCFLYEYRSGNSIYGVLNVREGSKVVDYVITEPKVTKSYFYEVAQGKGDVTLLEKKDSCLALGVSKSVYLYQKDNKIIRQNIKNGKEEVLYTYKNMCEQYLHIGKEFLLIQDEEKCFPVRWNGGLE